MADLSPSRTFADLNTGTLDLPWNGDFTLDSQGRTVIADGDTAFLQRIERRLLTTPRLTDSTTGRGITRPDYLFEPTFGAGMRRLVDRTYYLEELKRLVTAQVLADPETSQAPPPQIEVVATDTLATAGNSVVEIHITVVRKPDRLISFTLPFLA